MQHSQHSGAEPISRKLLKVYLADHLAGSTSGCGRMSRMATAHANTPDGERLTKISRELRMERAALKRIMRERRLGSHSLRQFIAWAGERLGRLKGNGRIFTPSPLTLLLELEIMRAAVTGKLGLWQTLQANSEELRIDTRLLASLINQAKQQLEELESAHENARTRSIRADGGFPPKQSAHTSTSAGLGGANAAGLIAAVEEDALPTDETDSPVDVAEKPGTSWVTYEHADSLVDEWGKESFPASDPLRVRVG